MNIIVMDNTEYKTAKFYINGLRNEKFYSKKVRYKHWTENQVYHRKYHDHYHTAFNA